MPSMKPSDVCNSFLIVPSEHFLFLAMARNEIPTTKWAITNSYSSGLYFLNLATHPSIMSPSSSSHWRRDFLPRGKSPLKPAAIGCQSTPLLSAAAQAPQRSKTSYISRISAVPPAPVFRTFQLWFPALPHNPPAHPLLFVHGVSPASVP